MTWHDISQLTTLPHLTSPHNQPHYFIAPCNQPHQNRSPHHHHGTAEGSFTQTTRFGHRSGWSPCAHSIGKFFLWLIVFVFWNFRPRLARLYLYLCRDPIMKQNLRPTGGLHSAMILTLQLVHARCWQGEACFAEAARISWERCAQFAWPLWALDASQADKYQISQNRWNTCLDVPSHYFWR